MRALRSHTRHLATLARAITQLGRAAKTVHLLDYCNDPHNRRTILGKLNRREAATTSPARRPPRRPQRNFSARDDLRHAPVDPHLGVM